MEITADDCVKLLREIRGKEVKRQWGTPRRPLSVVASEMARDVGGVRDDGVHAFGKRFVDNEDHVLLMWENRESLKNPGVGDMFAKRREVERAKRAAMDQEEQVEYERIRMARLRALFGILGRGWDTDEEEEEGGFVFV